MIRFAEKKDIPLIMDFIDNYWRKDHILARDLKVFSYEYVYNDDVNMIISENSLGNIDGVEGFIPYGKKNRDIMLALWKVVKSDNPMLGIEILQFLQKNADSERISCLGINERTIAIYEYMGYITGQMCQWYRLNPDTEYVIAKIFDNTIPSIKLQQTGVLCLFDTFEHLKAKFDFEKYYSSRPKPLKEDWYIEKRYFKHPIYQYQVYGIETDGSVDAFIVFRIQEYKEHRVLRLVDVVGNYSRLYNVTNEIDKLIKQYAVEYVDFYEIGLSDEEMKKAGWSKVKESGNIIPNYFAPFVQENIDINYMSQDADIILFKADGDQDRPN